MNYINSVRSILRNEGLSPDLSSAETNIVFFCQCADDYVTSAAAQIIAYRQPASNKLLRQVQQAPTVQQALIVAIEGFIANEIAVEASGDNGSYNVEKIPTVIAGRAALERARS